MDLSIVIVNWNTRDLLRDCLASLPEACGGLACEVFVVDNDSADGSAAMVLEEFPAVVLVEAGGNLGFSRGNNLALGRTRGDFVLLLNPDTVCPPGSLERLVAFAADRSGVAAVGPRLTTADGTPTITYGFFPRARHHWLALLDPLRLLPFAWARNRVVHVPTAAEPSARVEYVAGACFLMPRAALDRVGPLDEIFFMYFEETDWCRRARRMGLDVWYCAETEIVHLEGQAAEKASRFSILQFQKSYRLYMAKHHGSWGVAGVRWAQAFEYGLKSLVRRWAPGDRDRNRALAGVYGLRARLQLRSRIDVDIP